jgi:hypothetical protein
MTRHTRLRKWLGTSVVVAIVSAALALVPILEHPACAQQSWEPAPAAGQGQGYPPPAQGQGYYPPPGQGYYPPPAPFDSSRVIAQATQDAHADESGALWFFAGCLLGLIGIVIAAVVEPTPPPARLMGKSPEYISVYTTTYKSEGKSAQLRSALFGLGTTVVVFIVLYVIIIVAVVKSSPQTTY